MVLVNTVLGALESSQLGYTLAHEHVIVTSAGIAEYFPELLGTDLRRRIVDELLAAKAGGVTTIVDATTHDLGRDPRLLADAARASGVNIIACTGWWLDIPRALTGFSVDALAEVFTREVEEGIGNTDVKPGVIKGASDQAGVTEYEERVLRAVARAHRRTGLPGWRRYLRKRALIRDAFAWAIPTTPPTRIT
jgi:phosphotriesterase-related protein